ncbi:MAG: hypothetical protein RLZZ21_2754 [Planctomycetota bacterium]
MRLPRIFGKKRGHRRTGSEAWGSFGDGLFHGALVCAGVVFGALLISGVAVPEWRINHDFIESRGRVLGKGLVKRTVDDPLAAASTTWRPTVRLRYDVAGAIHEAWTRSQPSAGVPDRAAAVARLADWKLGSEVPLWYDPADPTAIVLERGYNWWMWLLALLLPGALVAFGGAGLSRAVRRWGRSEEALAAATGIPGLLGPRAPASPSAVDLAGLPPCDDLVNSPGTQLRYRLPLESPENWTLLGLGLFAAFWNAVLLVLAVGAGLEFTSGRVDWLLLALLVPFIAVGGAAIALVVRGLVLSAAVGTTQLEISDHPLEPGGTYDVLLAQGGSGRIRRLTLALELVEQATFRQGTDARTESLVVWRRQFDAWSDVALLPGARFEVRSTITIPSDAMHSFASEHNAVRWRLVVHGVPARWPAFLRVFPLAVYPGLAANPRETPRTARRVLA